MPKDRQQQITKGFKIRKSFDGIYYDGAVLSDKTKDVRDSNDELVAVWDVEYEDGDREQLTFEELMEWNVSESVATAAVAITTERSSRGRVRKVVSYNESNVDDTGDEGFDDFSSVGSENTIADDDLFGVSSERQSRKRKHKSEENEERIPAAKKKVKMSDAYNPINNPQNFRRTYDEVAETEEFFDPCGVEAHDDIIEGLMKEQFLKLGKLWKRRTKEMKQKRNERDRKQSRNVSDVIRLMTACSGTDAPALALQMFEEIAAQHSIEFRQNHLMSCEIEPFKQAFIQNNFDSTIYPDIGKLTTTENPRDIFGIESPLPRDCNLFVAGTVCKNFSMLRGTYKIDIEDKGVSGETFLAAVDVLEKTTPKWCIFENVIPAPWEKMAEYITGRVPIYLDAKLTKKLNGVGKSERELKSARNITFIKENNRYVTDKVGGYYGVRPGSILAGIHRHTTGKMDAIKTWSHVGNHCDLESIKKHFRCVAKSVVETDLLVFEKPCTYCTKLLKVDTKDFGLPQTRQRCYLFIWRNNKGDVEDDLGDYFECLVNHLKSPAKHSLESFLLAEDHDIVRVFREALLSGPGRYAAMAASMVVDFWASENKRDLKHHKIVRENSGFDDLTRFTTNWGPKNKFQVPPHYWYEYMLTQTYPHQTKSNIDIHAMSAMRDAEAHDSNFSSYFWNITQNPTRERHRGPKSGVAGCITPGGEVFLPHVGRILLGPEKLLLQGIPYFRLRHGNETEMNMSDLAGNAMSLTVVSACMLSALCADQFRTECKAEFQKKMEMKTRCNEGNYEGNLARDIIEATKDVVLKNCSILGESVVETDPSFEPPKGDNSISIFKELSCMSEEAYSAAILCTCESSERIAKPSSGKFVQCKGCAVTICANCVIYHNLSSHEMTEIKFPTGTRFDPNQFRKKLLRVLPAQLYIPTKSVNRICDIQNDKYGAKGLDKFIFSRTLLKRDRQRWKAIYTAKMNHGMGGNIAQLVLNLGALELGSGSYGLSALLYCFRPAWEGKRGKIEACLRLNYPKDAEESDVRWEICQGERIVTCSLVGRAPVNSTRIKMGILCDVEKTLKTTSQTKYQVRDIEQYGELGRRRWCYPPGWEEWPSEIHVCNVSEKINGLYMKLSCLQTTPHSALWRKQSSNGEGSLYIVLKPNVSRMGPDVGVITSSPNVHDNVSIKLLLNEIWQPSDPLQNGFQKVSNCKEIIWEAMDLFEVIAPESDVIVESADYIEDPKPNKPVLVATISGNSKYTMNLLTSHSQSPRVNLSKGIRLNLFEGIDGIKTSRVFSALLAPILEKHGSADINYNLDGSDKDAWYCLTSGSPIHAEFGYDEDVLPPMPQEQWYKDSERSELKNKGVYVRRPDPDESREFKKKIMNRPHGWEAYAVDDRGTNKVKLFMRPHVLAQLSAHALLAKRGLRENNNITMEYRLSNIRSQADPKIDEFRICNTNDLPESIECDFKKDKELYPRQRQALTKLLHIEEGKSIYQETEMSEQGLPGAGWTIATRASRSVPVKGGVCADAIGAGKTAVSIALVIKGLKKSRQICKNGNIMESAATLIVVPPALINQWYEEFDKFVHERVMLKVLKIYSIRQLMEHSVKDILSADAVIVPVDILEGDGKTGKQRGLYLDHLFDFTAKSLDESAKRHLSSEYDLKKAPILPRFWGAREKIGVSGVWLSAGSSDPYGGAMQSQVKKDDCGFFTHRYTEIIELLRNKCKGKIDGDTKGVPLEFYRWERIIVDEIHESLCTTKLEMDEARGKNVKDETFFSERNRGAAREFLGIAQSNAQKRPLRARGCIIGLTGTPLLDNENRVIELASLMGGTYITSQRSHWRKEERESGRDSFIQLWLEPQRSRMYRKEKHDKIEQWMSIAMSRNKALELPVRKREITCSVRLGEESTKGFLDSTPTAIRNFHTMPPDFDSTAGQDPTAMLHYNAQVEERKEKLRSIVREILAEEPNAKIIVFADAKYGGYEAACQAMGADATYFTAGDDNETKNKKLSWYKTIDVTEEDYTRPRVLILTFEDCAGLNLQTACHNVIMYVPMYSLENNFVLDCSTELQAIGRVYRTGQQSDVKIHKIVVDPPLEHDSNGEGTVDRWVMERNTSENALQLATNEGMA